MDEEEDESHVVGVTAMEKVIATVPDCIATLVRVLLRSNEQNLN